jgi:hypothetical protein
MAEFDHGFKTIARLAGRELARVAGVECRRWEVVESTLQATTERLADRVFRAQRGRERFLVYMEFYTQWDAAAPWNMLGKSGLLSEQEQLPTVCLLFVLRRQGYRSHEGTFRLEVQKQPTQQLWFREVPLWEQVPQPWWEEVPGLMALSPLCRQQGRPREVIAHAAEVIEQREEDTARRADLLYLLGQFGGLAFPRLDAMGLIGREKMRDSPISQSFIREGQVEQARHAVLRVLRNRFGEEAAAPFAEAINGLEDLERLDHLLDQASVCARIEDFRRAMTRRRR